MDNHHRSVLHMAVEGEFPNVVSVLLENGADPDQMGEEGNNGWYMYIQQTHDYMHMCMYMLSNITIREN